MNYNKLYYFYRAARAGTLSRAAEQLFISQPSLSKAVRDLEAELGVQLLTRTNRAVVPTPAGEELLQACAGLFDREAEVIRRVQAAGLEKYRQVHFGHMIYDVVYRLPSLLDSFAQLYPDIHVDTRAYNERSDITTALLQGTLDVGLKLFTMDEITPELGFQMLAEHHMLLVAPENHPLAGQGPVSLFQLHREKFVFLGADAHSTEYRYIWDWCTRCGFVPEIVAAYDNVGAVLMMVQSGAGVSLLSEFAPIDRMHGLCRIPLNNAPMNYSGVFWNKAMLSDAAQSFLTHLLAQLRQAPTPPTLTGR